jgi:hypothetical protein
MRSGNYQGTSSRARHERGDLFKKLSSFLMRSTQRRRGFVVWNYSLLRVPNARRKYREVYFVTEAFLHTVF